MNTLAMKDGRFIIESRKPKQHFNFKNRCGTIIKTKYGNCEIIKYRSKKDMDIVFKLTGGIRKHISFDNLIRDKVKDYLSISVYGIGFLGNKFDHIKKTYNKKLYKKIHSVWRDMIFRCYGIPENYDSYNLYKGANVIVDVRWHNFSNFFYDFQQLTGYDEEKFMNPKEIKGRLTLDKDILYDKNKYSNKIYSNETCCLVTMLEQSNWLSHTSDFIVTFPDGTSSVEHNVSDFSRKHNLCKSGVLGCLSGKCKSHKGYKFKPIEKCND